LGGIYIMNVCERLKELTVSIIAIDMLALESLVETSATKQELITLFYESGKTLKDISDRFFIEEVTASHWIYLEPTHRHGVREPRRSELVRFLK